MKQKDVVIGAVYAAKVSRQMCRVRILRESPYGGWDAVNLETGRRIRIRGVQRLRYRIFDKPAQPRQQQDAAGTTDNGSMCCDTRQNGHSM